MDHFLNLALIEFFNSQSIILLNKSAWQDSATTDLERKSALIHEFRHAIDADSFEHREYLTKEYLQAEKRQLIAFYNAKLDDFLEASKDTIEFSLFKNKVKAELPVNDNTEEKANRIAGNVMVQLVNTLGNNYDYFHSWAEKRAYTEQFKYEVASGISAYEVRENIYKQYNLNQIVKNKLADEGVELETEAPLPTFMRDLIEEWEKTRH